VSNFCILARLLLIATCAIIRPSQAEAPFSVVATTSIIADTARSIAGPLATVTALMGPGIDPHLYKASPGDLRILSNASLILHNGLHLEGKLADALSKLSSRKTVVAVTDGIPRDKLRSVSEDGEVYDPHVWFDVSLWIACAQGIRDALMRHDPPHAADYSNRFSALATELQQLDTWAREQIASIPASNRVLITAHDAFGYFGRAYGIEVLAIQGVSTESEASLRSINELVATIVKRKIPAIFIENTISPKAVEALVEGAKARGHTVTIGGQLLGDSLGDRETAEESYSGTVKHNVLTITKALAAAVPGEAT
jgi:manganese/zinc/iron transport system substrate-binding protein